jgi:hypothetical protein
MGHKGPVMSVEARRKIAASLEGKSKSLETRRNMKEAQKRLRETKELAKKQAA